MQFSPTYCFTNENMVFNVKNENMVFNISLTSNK